MRSLLLVSLLLVAACNQEPPPVAQDQAIRPARLFQITGHENVTRHLFVGKVEAAQTVDVSFQVAGQLIELDVLEGQQIKKGVLMAALDPHDYELALREARVQLDIARDDYERKKSLINQRSISQSSLDDARALFQLRLVRFSQARESLADTKIFAPLDAQVSRRFTDNHSNISAGQKVVRLSDLSVLHISANIPESLLATINADQIRGLFARFAFIPDQQFELSYVEYAGEAQSVAQTYEVTFAMEPPEQWNILPGMIASVDVQLASVKTDQTTFIPSSALVAGSDDGLYVWVFDSQTNLVSRRSIEIGPIEEKGAPVIHGLEVGEIIVSAGAGQLQPGMKVRPLGKPETLL